jgi:hypothetical protein
MRQLRRRLTGLMVAGLVMLPASTLAGCGAPAYTYAADHTDQAYFKIPSNWRQVSPTYVAQADQALSKSAAGAEGGRLAWARAYSPGVVPAQRLLTASTQPVVYASVQDLRSALRASLSFDFMRDLLFPVTAGARKQATADGEKLAGFALINNTTITTASGMRGINELFVYDVGGLPDAFDQTVLTNSNTTKLYLLLVQCYQDCFLSHRTQIAAIVSSFTVGGGS